MFKKIFNKVKKIINYLYIHNTFFSMIALLLLILPLWFIPVSVIVITFLPLILLSVIFYTFVVLLE